MIKTSSNKLYVKKYLLLLLLIIFFYFLKMIYEYFSYNYNIPVTINSNNNEIIYSEYYSINNFEIIHTKLDKYNFKAIPNFKKTYTSQDIIDNYKCDIIINGAFYMKSFEPLGLYYYDKIQLGVMTDNNIFNGIISLNEDKVWDISKTSTYLPKKSNIFEIQSGPLLVFESKYTNIPTFDNSGRRIVFVLDKFSSPSILVIYKKDLLNEGPEFKDLVDIIKILINENGVDIYDAINLDGGNSSLYIDDNISLKENAFSGSYLCFYN